MRLFCRMSKIAKEDVCSTYILPHTGLSAVNMGRAGLRCFIGLLDDRKAARGPPCPILDVVGTGRLSTGQSLPESCGISY